MKMSANSGPFENIGQKQGTPRSSFDLSYEKKMTMDMGQLIPVLCDEAVPGDVWSIGNSAVLRFQPMVAPILHRVQAKTYYFFVPYRLLDDAWETFITRGVDGNQVVTLPLMDPALVAAPGNMVLPGTLWDYFGFPCNGDYPASASCPIDYPRRAYLQIYNDYFRDETLQTEVDPLDLENYNVLYKNWAKDYFTSALLTQQRGNPPALPVFGTAPVLGATSAAFGSNPWLDGNIAGGSTALFPGQTGGTPFATGAGAGLLDFSMNQRLNANTIGPGTFAVDGSAFTSVDIADLRLAWQLQVWMERNNRAGVRYVEFLEAHYGVSPKDERLQRPEYIGGTTQDAVISEVLQTAETATTPQGNMAGHGIVVQGSRVGTYRVEEFGVIMGLMCVMPIPAYQNGLNRQWLRRTTFDFYFPEFAGLSEQEIYNMELSQQTVLTDPLGTANAGVFGFTGRYNEMRYKPNQVCGQMRNTYAYWHLGRILDTSTAPILDSAFITADNIRKDIFAAPSEPALIVSFGNHLNVLRPLPFIAEPTTIGY